MPTQVRTLHPPPSLTRHEFGPWPAETRIGGRSLVSDTVRSSPAIHGWPRGIRAEVSRQALERPACPASMFQPLTGVVAGWDMLAVAKSRPPSGTPSSPTGRPITRCAPGVGGALANKE